jgi:hypothetical protein
VPADAVGDNAWAKAKNFEAGQDVLSKSFLGSELNEIALELGIPSDTEGTLVVRIMSYLDRPAYSEATSLTVTPYLKNVIFGEIFVPGGYQTPEWNVDTAAPLTTIDNGVYQGWISFPENRGLSFKFTPERNWETFYGQTESGALEEGNDRDLSVDAPGSYQITANLNNNTWSYVPYSWGIVGTATAGSWDASTEMTYDHQQKLWKFTGNLQAGALKFRLNNNWDVNYGPTNSEDGILYLGDQGAHTVTEAGTYEVTFSLDPSNPETALYTIKPISWGIVGDATPGSWDASTPMTYDSEAKLWKITADLVPGAVKFRLNNEWAINYGPRNNEDGIVYLDDPGAHSIAEAGSYEITFKENLYDATIATYSVQKIE